MEVIDIDEVVCANASHGKHFFSPNTNKFFSSKTYGVAYKTEGRPFAFFVTSEKDYWQPRRLYSVRLANLESGRIATIGDHQQYRTLNAARSVAIELAKTYRQCGGQGDKM